MRVQLLLATLLASAQISIAQNTQLIDSLKQSLQNSKPVDRFNLLNSIAWEYRFAQPDSTIHYAQEAFNFGKDIGLKVGLALPLNYLGVAYNYKGDRLSAVSKHQQAIEIATQQNDSVQLGHSFNSIGRVYYEQGMMKHAFDNFLRAEKIFELTGDLSGQAYVYQSMGNMSRAQNDFKEATEYYVRAQQIREKLGVERDLTSGLIMLGRLHKDQLLFNESNEYLKRASVICNKLGDQVLLAEINMVLAENYLLLGNKEKAEIIAFEAFQSFSKINSKKMIPSSATVLGKIYFERGKIDEAIKYFQIALDAAHFLKQAVVLRESYYWLWKSAEKKGDQTAILRYQNSYLIMKDSTKRLELAREVDRLQFQVEVEKKERENLVLKETELKNAALIGQQRLQNLILILAVGTGTAFIFLLIVNNRKRKKANNQLERRNQQLFDLNNEKDTLMNIVVHDLKAPLNNISGLSNLLRMDGELNPIQDNDLKLIKESAHRGLLMITDLLDAHAMESEQSISIEKVDLNDFISRQTNTFIPVASGKSISISLKTHGCDDPFYTDKKLVTRILDNLISNAIKFSPPESTVSVNVVKSEKDVQISIRDLGQGFSEADKKNLFQKFKKLSSRPTAGESSNGLGLAIVKILIDRLNGQIELKSEKGQGSEFIITIPNREK
jgi:signal transduction histidine kinase